MDGNFLGYGNFHIQQIFVEASFAEQVEFLQVSVWWFYFVFENEFEEGSDNWMEEWSLWLEKENLSKSELPEELQKENCNECRS